jgi:hypothetical protein
MNNLINVVGSGTGHEVVGYITAVSGMPVKFHSFASNLPLVVQSVSQDLVIASGSGTAQVNYKEYAFYTYITSTDAVSYGWPTGGGSQVFTHSGFISQFVRPPVYP